MRRHLAVLALALATLVPVAADAQVRKGSDSGLPLPRFVSLKSAKVNMRVGPGREYRVEWQFTRAGTPVEIVAEFDNWRRVRDAEGTEGWVYGALLTGRRTAVVAPWLRDAEVDAAADGVVTPVSVTATPVPTVTIHVRDDRASPAVARLEAGVTGMLTECNAGWCRFSPMRPTARSPVGCGRSRCGAPTPTRRSATDGPPG